MIYQRHSGIARTLLATLALFGLLVSAHRANAQDGTPDPEETTTFSKLTFELATSRRDFIEEEPVPLILSLTNKTSESALGHDAIGFLPNHLRVYVSQEGGERRQIERLTRAAAMIFVTPHLMKPEEQHQEVEALNLDLDEIFPRPGEYQLQAVLRNTEGEQEISSNVITIRISKPQGRDLQAHRHIKGLGKRAHLLNGGDPDDPETTHRRLVEFVMRFGDTAYGDYASLLLGTSYYARDEFDEAQKVFETLAAKRDFVLAHKVQKYLGKLKEEKAKDRR